jgi:hypothetical protein
MKKLILSFFALILAISVIAEDKELKKRNESDNSASIAISGTVYDLKSGELLTGVEVKIEGTDIKSYTDFDGNFHFQNIKPGDYKLITTYISYKSNIETFRLDAKENRVKIMLENSN